MTTIRAARINPTRTLACAADSTPAPTPTLILTLAITLAGSLLGCGEDAYETYRARGVDQINAYRATLSLAPLERWTEAEGCSDDEAKSDASTGRAHGAFGECSERAQNECPGWPSAEDVVTGCLAMMWAEGPGEPYSAHGHYINMTSTAVSKVAIGFYTTAEGRVWSVQNFQ